MSFKDFSESGIGFIFTQTCSLIITGLGVYAAIYWNERENKKKRNRNHRRMLAQIAFQTHLRDGLIQDRFHELLNAGNFKAPSTDQLTYLASFLPTADRLFEIINDANALQYIVGIRENFDWIRTDKGLDGINDLWMLGLNLLRLERSLFEIIGKNEYANTANLLKIRYQGQLYSILSKFGILIPEDLQPNEKSYEDGKYLDYLIPALFSLAEAVKNQEENNWNLSQDKMLKIRIIYSDFEIEIQGFDSSLYNYWKERRNDIKNS
jgi:hypothetical protein